MRCKAGDRAVIVGGYRDNIGVLVDVEYLHPAKPTVWRVKLLCSALAYRDPEWLVLPPGEIGCIGDENLWPLRDQPGTDEMLTIAGLPKSHWVKHRG